MGLAQDLFNEVKGIFASQWTVREGSTVPESANIKLGNDAVKLQGAVLYADIHSSTQLVDSYQAYFAAEIYKAYLHCAAKIVRAENGSITAYDGDRIMAVFIGDFKNTSAVRAGLKIHYAVANIVNPCIRAQYPSAPFVLKHVVGIDTSTLYIARTGIRGSNDLVWVGRAANYAAKLAALPPDYPTWITKDVYDNSNDVVKNTGGRAMWEPRTWTAMNNLPIYRSNWWWRI